MKEFKYIRTASKNDKPIKDIINTIVDQNKRLHNGLTDQTIKEIWYNSFGKSIVNYTEDIKFRGGIVYIQLTSAALKKELSQSKDQIIHIFNTKQGSEIVKKVVIQ